MYSRGLFSCTHLLLFAHNPSEHNTWRPRQNGRHFPDDIFKYIFLGESVWNLFEISLKFVFKGAINNIPALVQIMAWRLPGDKPLSEPMIVRLPTHICVTRPQWVKEQGLTNYRLHDYLNVFLILETDNCLSTAVYRDIYQIIKLLVNIKPFTALVYSSISQELWTRFTPR